MVCSLDTKDFHPQYFAFTFQMVGPIHLKWGNLHIKSIEIQYWNATKRRKQPTW